MTSQLITPRQIKAARALLGWNMLQLAERAGIGLGPVAGYECRGRVPRAKNYQAMTAALEGAGCVFVQGGVVLREAISSQVFLEGVDLQV